MRNTFLQKTTTKLLRFLELQLFITIVSLPILIAWGILFSLLSFVGNLIFAPLFTCFLFLSSIIFFCQLLHIPSTLFISALTCVTNFWTTSLNFGSHNALIGYALQPTPILIALPLGALFFLQHKILSKTMLRRISGYSGLLIIFCLYITVFGTSQQSTKKITHNGRHATIVHDKGNITVVDQGALGSSFSSESWSEYTLIPTIIKETGCSHIDTLILTKPGKIMLDVVKKLCEKISIKQIYLIIWEGTLPKHYWRSFFRLKETAQKHNITFSRIGNYPITIETSATTKIKIQPEKKLNTSGPFLYHQLRINHIIDNDVVPLV